MSKKQVKVWRDLEGIYKFRGAGIKMRDIARTEPKKRVGVGIDPSLTGTGVAMLVYDTVAGRVEDFVSHTIRTDVKKGDGRLVEIDRALLLLLEYVVSELPVAIEDLPVHAHSAGITGMSQGIVRAFLQREVYLGGDGGGLYKSFPPASLKKYATGKGNANKNVMREQFEADTAHLLEGEAPLNQGYHVDDNQVDAFYLALWAALGYPETGEQWQT